MGRIDAGLPWRPRAASPLGRWLSFHCRRHSRRVVSSPRLAKVPNPIKATLSYAPSAEFPASRLRQARAAIVNSICPATAQRSRLTRKAPRSRVSTTARAPNARTAEKSSWTASGWFGADTPVNSPEAGGFTAGFGNDDGVMSEDAHRLLSNLHREGRAPGFSRPAARGPTDSAEAAAASADQPDTAGCLEGGTPTRHPRRAGPCRAT
jgi:hypothetical protein